MSEFTLKTLTNIVGTRAKVTDGSSYTASLVEKGMTKATKKLGEEAVETVIAALAEDKHHLIGESADLLYHLAVVWEIAGINVDDVMAELNKRTAQTGLQEKAARQP
ncbi:phosphoribosyl-ATP diphosphatase [Bartonella sp. HY761]|uniref:phosphoribosyl-ATP diphosphatase n=1 Tax=Bartonella sp. HY761 TaxID=2979330 RepID=UPI00220220C5|nr:phosphoribosyl-ATP diphosphatase [Bartonella sp. HY761]UXN07012.1 phosphoribosyl-ATP diphosphatase [Bartonella sp. HY761]